MLKVKVKSCPTLCDPVDCSPSGSSVHGILQARILEWVAISFSRGSSQPSTSGSLIVQSLSHVRLCATPWTVAHQAPLSVGFSKQEYWSGLPFPEYYLLNTYYVLDNLPRALAILLLNDPFRPSSLLLFLTHT